MTIEEKQSIEKVIEIETKIKLDTIGDTATEEAEELQDENKEKTQELADKVTELQKEIGEILKEMEELGWYNSEHLERHWKTRNKILSDKTKQVKEVQAQTLIKLWGEGTEETLKDFREELEAI